jgi:hypothetical protein
MSLQISLPRRRFVLRSLSLAAAVGLAGCQSLPAFSLEEAVRRLLYRSTQRAFARLTEPEGYWEATVRDAGLANLLGVRGDVLADVLTSPLFRSRLESAFADIAFEATDRAAPVVTDAVRVIGISNALALVNGGPRAATAFLRGSMGARLIDTMLPEVRDAIHLSQDPLIASLLHALTGVDMSSLTDTFVAQVEETIWREIGNEEAAIRADPASTGDATLIGVFANPAA